MDAKVKGQGHKVTLDENSQSADNVLNARISKWHDIAQYTLHNRQKCVKILSVNDQVSFKSMLG